MDHRTRVAVVTGGSAGIGLAAVSRLARDGVRAASLDLVAGGVGDLDAERAQWIECDVADSEAVAAAIHKVRSSWGAPTIAVHSAAVQQMVPFDELSESMWERTWRVNVGGAVNLARSVVPGMQAAAWGRLIFVSSSSFVTPPSQMAHYIATKGALIGLARGLASDLGATGITVNTVAPGLTRTANAVASVSDAHFDLVLSRQQIPRSGKPEDQASAIAFLASEDAAFITGQTLLVDGGEGHI